jgi:uncharacterized protein
MAHPALRRTIVTHLRIAVPDLLHVVLFGSQARGTPTPESDVDVALLAAAPLPIPLVTSLRLELELATSRDVHVVDLRAASTVFRHQVIETGEVLYTVGGAEVAAFLDFVLRDYVRLNEARGGILRDVRERGRVHGR